MIQCPNTFLTAKSHREKQASTSLSKIQIFESQPHDEIFTSRPHHAFWHPADRWAYRVLIASLRTAALLRAVLPVQDRASAACGMKRAPPSQGVGRGSVISEEATDRISIGSGS
jgi:hypothetical protein